MSEHLRPGHEVQPNAEQHHGKERHVGSHEKEHHLEKHKGELERQVESHAKSAAEVAAKVSETNSHEPHSHHISKDIKNLTFNRNMVRIRKRLSAPNKVLSKVIHQPTVERVSEAAGQTIARPSGLFGGGLFAFLGTLALLYITRKYGYEFNYLVFFMLFVGGFAFGAVLELLYKAFKQRNINDM